MPYIVYLFYIPHILIRGYSNGGVKVVEFRKLIKFGDSSFVISLPKDWIEKHKLVKGDTIFLQEQEGSLLLNARETSKKREQRSIVIDIDNKDLDSIQTEIVSSYLTNFDIIEVRGSSLKDNAPKIKDFLHDLAGLEVIEQTKDKIIAKDLLNISEISIQSMIRRMDVIVRSMLDDSIASFDENSYDNIQQRDKEVNRLSLLTHRVIRLALRDHDVAKSLGAKHLSLLVDWQMVTSIEKIGDQSKRIARNLRETGKSNPHCQKDFKGLMSHMVGSYLDIMKCYYQNEKKKAYNIETEHRSRIDLCCKLEKKCSDTASMRVIYNLKSMSTSIQNIARNVINSED